MGRARPKITETMRKGALMAAEGKTYAEIAAELNVAKSTVTRWFHREDMQMLRSAELHKVVATLVPRAYAILSRQLDDKNGWLAQSAAREVIRLHQQMQGAADASVLVSFAGMPAPGTPQTAGALPEADMLEYEFDTGDDV